MKNKLAGMITLASLTLAGSAFAQMPYGGGMQQQGSSYSFRREYYYHRQWSYTYRYEGSPQPYGGQRPSYFDGRNRYERHFDRGGSSPYAHVPGAHLRGLHQRPPMDYGLRIPREPRGHAYMYGHPQMQQPPVRRYHAPHQGMQQKPRLYLGQRCFSQWDGRRNYMDCR